MSQKHKDMKSNSFSASQTCMSRSGARDSYEENRSGGGDRCYRGVVLREQPGHRQEPESKWNMYAGGCTWEQSCAIQAVTK